MSSIKLSPRCFHFFVFAAFCLFFSHTTVYGKDLVTARYISASGNSIVLTLSIGKPGPANLIVEQYIPPGNTVLTTSPKAQKIDHKKGKVKWLFRNTTSGNFRLSITLKEPITGGVEAMVRYRAPKSGAFNELRISP